MQDTVESIAEKVANKLGDYNATTYRLERVRLFFPEAYNALHSLFVSWGLPRAEAKVYWIIPAYTSMFYPLQSGIGNFGEPTECGVSERGGLTSVAIESISNETPRRVVTQTAHNLVTGNQVTIAGAQPYSMNQQAFVTKVDSLTLTLNGTVAGDEYVGGGSVVTSADPFLAVRYNAGMIPSAAATDRITAYDWDGVKFTFTPASSDREVQITYETNGQPPDSGVIDYVGATSFLVSYTAAKIAKAQGEDSMAESLLREACGDSGLPDGTGGYLREYCLPKLRVKNAQMRAPQPFRVRRGRGLILY